MKIAYAAVAGLALMLTLMAGCGPATSKHRTPERPAPTKAVAPPPVADPNVNQPGPQADPGNCNERGPRPIELQAHWTSETKATPSVNWTLNGVSTPATNLNTHSDGLGKMYSGEWSTLVNVKCGDLLSVNLRGNASFVTVICAVIDLGQDKIVTGRRDCAVSYQVP